MDDNDSIASFEEDEVNDMEKLNQPQVEPKLSKGGKIKKPQTEAQKQNLVKARAKGMAKRKEMKELRDKEKRIKEEDILLRRLDVEAKVLEHETKKKAMFKRAGYVNESKEVKEPKVKKERAKYGSKCVPDTTDEEEEIRMLEEKLSKLKTKNTLLEKGHAPKDYDSDSDTSPPESEDEIAPPPKIERKALKKPEMKEDKKREDIKNPMSRTKENIDPALLAQLRSLFPNFPSS